MNIVNLLPRSYSTTAYMYVCICIYNGIECMCQRKYIGNGTVYETSWTIRRDGPVAKLPNVIIHLSLPGGKDTQFTSFAKEAGWVRTECRSEDEAQRNITERLAGQNADEESALSQPLTAECERLNVSFMHRKRDEKVERTDLLRMKQRSDDHKGCTQQNGRRPDEVEAAMGYGASARYNCKFNRSSKSCESLLLPKVFSGSLRCAPFGYNIAALWRKHNRNRFQYVDICWLAMCLHILRKEHVSFFFSFESK